MIEGATTHDAADRAAPGGRRPRIALAHDWLCGYRGGEAVVERLALLIESMGNPAWLYVMFDDGGRLSPTIDRWRERGLVRPSWLDLVPLGSGALRRWLLPFYPSAVESLSRRLLADHAKEPIDLLISSSSAAIKGLRPPPGVPHLCYCHSPARYVWSRRDDYGGRGLTGRLRALGLRAYGGRFKRWDRDTASTVNRFVANSSHTASQIRECFGVEASVVHPPVRTAYFKPDSSVPREDFWLVVSALEPYKRVDLAIDAARAAGARLVIAGDGSQRAILERHAGPTIEFRGRIPDAELRDLYRRASVLLFPQVEDFGIVAAEALACGLPIAARAQGGAFDIVQDGITGALFTDPTPTALTDAARRAAPLAGDPCRTAATRFSESAFDESMEREIRSILRPTPASAR